MEHFGAVFKLHLTEETKMQLQEEEAVVSSCLILAMPMAAKYSYQVWDYLYLLPSSRQQ